MFRYLKNLLKKVVPPPINVFNREINRIIKQNEKNSVTLTKLIKQTDAKNAKQSSNLLIMIKQLNNKIEQLSKENNNYKVQLLNIDKKIRLLQNNMKDCEGYASETVWA